MEVTENIKGINKCPQPMQEYSLLTRTVNVCERDREKMERKRKKKEIKKERVRREKEVE